MICIQYLCMCRNHPRTQQCWSCKRHFTIAVMAPSFHFINSTSLRSIWGTTYIASTCSWAVWYHSASRMLFVTAWLKSCSVLVYFSIALRFPPAALTANFPALSSSSTSSVMDQREEWLAITSTSCRGSLRLLFPRNVFTNNFWCRPKWV